MNVLYAADDNFAEVMAVSIKSLIDTQRKKLKIFIVDNGISEKNICRIKQLQEDNVELIFIEQPDIVGLLGLDLVTLRWGYTAFARLFLKEIFSGYDDIKRVLYLDCDTLVVDSLDELWNIDLKGYLGAACLECISNQHKKIIDARPEDNYINTGMLLIDVERWIEDDVTETCIEFIRKHKGKIECVDQGVINGTISNRFLIISPRYNLTSLAYDVNYEEMQIFRKPQFGYPKNVWTEALSNPVVIHFNKSFLSIRPWYEASNHLYADKWIETRERTLWGNLPLRIQKISAIGFCKLGIINIIPRKLMISLAGFLHAYVKPMVFVLKRYH